MSINPLEQLVSLGARVRQLATAGEEPAKTARTVAALRLLVDRVPMRRPWGDNGPAAPRL